MTDIESRELDPIRGDFARVRDRLKLRLYPSDYGADGAVVAAKIADGLQAVLVFDLPSAIAPVRPADLRAWARPAEELIALALENVRRQEQVRVDPMGLAQARLFTVSGESVFVATLGMTVEDLLGPSELGALVAVPSSHLVVCHSLLGQRSAQEAFEAMTAIATRVHAAGPHALSPLIYRRLANEMKPVADLAALLELLPA